MRLGFSYLKFPNWMRGRGEPDLVIGGAERPYMLRWYVVPRNSWFNVYLHRIKRSDDDRALHDHPWPSLSVLLKGRLGEWHGDAPAYRSFKAGAIVYRPAEFKHRLVVYDDTDGALTLFITGPKVREWGFWCPQGFKHWRDFTAADDSGKIGKGCSE